MFVVSFVYNFITRIKYYLKRTMGYFSSLYKSWVWFKLILTSFLKDVSNCYFLYLFFLLKGMIITSNIFESSTFPSTQCLAGSGTLEYLLNKSYIAKLQKKKKKKRVLGLSETCWVHAIYFGPLRRMVPPFFPSTEI